MRMIYVDSDFKCHISDDGTMTALETNFFDDKCDVFVEGYRFIPKGELWTRSDGEVFRGEMIAPWKNLKELELAQDHYEQQQKYNRITALEEENAMLLECVLEMSEVIYA